MRECDAGHSYTAWQLAMAAVSPRSPWHDRDDLVSTAGPDLTEAFSPHLSSFATGNARSGGEESSRVAEKHRLSAAKCFFMAGASQPLEGASQNGRGSEVPNKLFGSASRPNV